MRILLYLFILFLSLQPAWADIRFLTISDIHYGSENDQGDGKDTGITLLASSLKKFKQLANKADFILTLGDFVTHGANYANKAASMSTVFHELYKEDSAAKPLFYITGNNDSLHGNYQPFSWSGQSPLSLAKDWQGACVHCAGLLIDGKHLQNDGYYSTFVVPGNKEIVLIALNSTQFAKLPFFTLPYPQQDRDALHQLKWLENQLKTHYAKQLLIAMHIPPGTNYNGGRSWREEHLKQFINLLNLFHKRYGQISLLTSHTHMDDIRKMHLNDGTTIYAYATPSISRIHHNYPAMKVFDLGNTLQVKNYTTYFTTSDAEWGDEHYQAMEHIFPQCSDNILDKCLNTLTNESVCKTLKEGLFYGAKNPRVNSSVCKITYPVN